MLGDLDPDLLEVLLRSRPNAKIPNRLVEAFPPGPVRELAKLGCASVYMPEGLALT